MDSFSKGSEEKEKEFAEGTGISRKHIPEAACKVKASTTYVCIAWKTRLMPAPTQAMP